MYFLKPREYPQQEMERWKLHSDLFQLQHVALPSDATLSSQWSFLGSIFTKKVLEVSYLMINLLSIVTD